MLPVNTLSILHGVLVGVGPLRPKRGTLIGPTHENSHTQLHIAKCWESTCHYPWSIYPNCACLRFVYTESPLSTVTSNTGEEICENWKPNMSQEQFGQKELLYLQVCTAPPPNMIIRPSSWHCTTTHATTYKQRGLKREQHKKKEEKRNVPINYCPHDPPHQRWWDQIATTIWQFWKTCRIEIK